MLTLAVDEFETYQWSIYETSQEITINGSGIYSVTVTDQNSCSNAATFEVFEISTPIIDSLSGAKDVSLSSQQAYQFHSLDSYEKVEWRVEGGSLLSSDFDMATILWDEEVTEGRVCVLIRTKENCSSLEFCELININSVSTFEPSLQDIMLFPNPCDNELNILGTMDQSNRIDIYNNVGQRILKNENTNSLDVSSLFQGVYLMKLKIANGKAKTFKFFKK